MIKREKIQRLFGEIVRKERKLQKITQSELAERSHLDNTYISQIERGLANPSIFTLYKIAGSLGLSEREIFQKMSKELTPEASRSLNPVDELEIIYDAIVKLDASLLLTTTQDDDYRIIYCNEAFTNITKHNREDIIGRKLVDILGDGKNEEELLGFLSHLKEEPNSREYISSSISEGEPLQLEVNVSSIKSENKELEKHLFLLQQKFYRIKPDQEVDETVNKYKDMLNESNDRLKNHLSIIAGVIDVNISDLDDGDIKSTLQDTQLRISSIAHIHELLTNSDDHSKLGIRDYLDKLVRVISNTYDIKDEVDLKTNIEVKDLGIDEVIALGLLSNELITNSYKYAFRSADSGRIELSLKNGRNGELVFSYRDNGAGFEKVIFEEGKTLGFNLVHAFLEQLEARKLTVDTDNGFSLSFEFDSMNVVSKLNEQAKKRIN